MRTLHALGLAILTVIAPIQMMLVTVSGLAALDLCLGIAASLKRGDRVTSQGLRRTVLKALLYQLAVITGYAVQSFLTGPSIPILNMITSLIGLTELKSILEHLGELSGDRDNAFSNLVTKLNTLTSGKEILRPADEERPSRASSPDNQTPSK